jgi:hypothetical protein
LAPSSTRGAFALQNPRIGKPLARSCSLKASRSYDWFTLLAFDEATAAPEQRYTLDYCLVPDRGWASSRISHIQAKSRLPGHCGGINRSHIAVTNLKYSIAEAHLKERSTEVLNQEQLG